jgi:NADPH-dependent 2,4-dienoyl-CoA reductase/sulfur reductase-like enzyme/rhodanese-related sulfurtransferase
MKILIVGAVAAGTSAAAKSRRNDETAEIKIFETDSDISYSACGLPYYIGNEVRKREDLVPRDPGFFKRKYNIEILTEHQVLKINPKSKSLVVKNLATSEEYIEDYDKLVISTGAKPFLPEITGIDKKNVFILRNVGSADKIKNHITKFKPKKALIIGSGFIGLEILDNFKALGIDISLVETEAHLMKSLDADVAAYLKEILDKKDIKVYLNDFVSELEGGKDFAKKARLKNGTEIETDIIIVGAGIKPDVSLAKEAGIEIGLTGAIKVNKKMETNLKDIYACGDCAESYSLITGKNIYRPLGSTANKTGRIAGDSMTGGNLEFQGILGTGIFKIFDFTVAQTGLTEKEAITEGYDVAVSHIIKPDSQIYYRGEEMMIKAVADKETMKLLGAQIIGKAGVDKRIDVFATAITFGAKVQDLFHLDLAYAPPYSTTKDPVMYTGMVLTNEIERNRKLITSELLEEKLKKGEKVDVIDVRTQKQYFKGHIRNAVNIPIEVFRDSIEKMDKDSQIVLYCNTGVSGNAAQNILINKGFKFVYNLSGGYKNYIRVKSDLI